MMGNNLQTFLPHSSFSKSAQCLDYRRLGKQRVEAYQILLALEDQWALSVHKNPSSSRKGWKNHPATLIWKGHEDALKLYMNCCISEWVARGYKNNMPLAPVQNDKITMPKHVGNEKYHASHRAALLYKDTKYYSSFGWKEEAKIDYVWKVEE